MYTTNTKGRHTRVPQGLSGLVPPRCVTALNCHPDPATGTACVNSSVIESPLSRGPHRPCLLLVIDHACFLVY